MRSFPGKFRYAIPLLFIFLVSCQKKKDYKEVFHDPFLYESTVHALNYAVIYDIFSPPVASRIFAYSCIAGYETMTRSNPGLPRLDGKVPGLNNIPDPPAGASVDFEFASLIALSTVGQALIFTEDKMNHYMDSVRTLAQQSTMSPAMYQASIDYGKAVADSVLSWSKKDVYAQTRGIQHTISHEDGHWVPTPPGYFAAVEPAWESIRTIALDSPNQFKVPGPIPFSKKPGSPFYNMVKQVMDTVNSLNKERKWIANFWDCNSFALHVEGHLMFATKAMTPCGHWMEVTGTICKLKHADFGHTAETYAGTSIGMFDGFITCWWAKYYWDLIRPETYINEYINPDWKPYLQTPPFPEYYSAHSTISAAAATVLGRLYGNNTAFRDSSERDWGWPDRHFNSMDDAANEVGMSRFFGGIHYFNSVMEGTVVGKKVGNLVMDKLFTPPR
ncbi:MAG TPA: vanadium-dependent haloperoxidase [Chitinophagaceae bacterium]|nr:vanadium-dependent haloperoxidase [Chitinophagaceae bacterium]